MDESRQALKSEEKENQSFKRELFEWLEILVTSVVVVVLIFTFLFKVVTIDGDSMQNTFFNKDKVIITGLFYEPKRGDVVVISRNAQNSYLTDNYDGPIIKRVIATEGQTVDIDFKKGIVYVDGVALDEPYVKTPTNEPGNVSFPFIVEENCIFVLGDNRNDSKDSRFREIGKNGQIDTRFVMGKVVLRIYPFDKIGGFD